jgi:hypothetical protein
MEPEFDAWDYRQQMSERFPEEELERLAADQSPEALAKRKSIYLEILKGSLDLYKTRLEQIRTQRELDTFLDVVMDEGKRARFQVKQVFRGEKQDSIDVWTDFSDCGFEFHKGETYLVYADQDEETQRFVTGACSRTKRLSDAGEDLAYLYFLQNGGTEASRIYGFVTSNELDLRTPRYWDRVKSSSSWRSSAIEVRERVTLFQYG